jgi:hypothetical protein
LQVSLQTPAAQDDDALVVLQTLPHMPQFCVSLPMLTVQPMFGLPPQLANPGSHLTGSQIMLEHDADSFGNAHGELQAAQFWTVLSGASQPFAGFMSQSPKPLLQTSSHMPATQLALALSPPHTIPHAPQFVGSVCVEDSQPSAGLPLQFP